MIEELLQYGLNEKEAKIYMSLLELEIAKAQDISKLANINRSSTYVTLESLISKGLVSISNDKNIRLYIASSPEVILRHAENMVNEKEIIYKKIEKIVPELKSLYKGSKKKPVVRIFEGKEGLISAFDDALKSSEKFMRVYSSPGNLNNILGDYLMKFGKKRFKLGIKMNGIHPNDKLHKQLIMNNPNSIDKYALIPPVEYNFPADLAIYDNKIGYMSARDGGIAVIIESKEMSDVMKSVFDLAFKEASNLNKN